MSVKLRSKKTKDGGESLYLDIYYKGKRKYEFLGLTIKKNDPDRKKIKEIAEKRRSQKNMENFLDAYDLPNYYNGKEDFLKYYEKNCLTPSYLSSHNKFKKFVENKLVNDEFAFNKIDEKLCENYKEWLFKQELKNNTVGIFLFRLKTILNKAVKDKIIPFNPARYVKIKMEDTEKTFLTFDEVKKLSEKECKVIELKRAFLFSCFTGLRLSDILALTWQQIREGKIYFRQKKTRGLEYLKIPSSAIKILYEDNKPEELQDSKELIFNIPLKKKGDLSRHLRKWAKLAEIDKEITFHTARHTFATMSLTYGIDLYTVSKMLGHKNINTTQVYAKIINEKVNEAVNKLPTL